SSMIARKGLAFRLQKCLPALSKAARLPSMGEAPQSCSHSSKFTRPGNLEEIGICLDHSLFAPSDCAPREQPYEKPTSTNKTHRSSRSRLSRPPLLCAFAANACDLPRRLFNEQQYRAGRQCAEARQRSRQHS